MDKRLEDFLDKFGGYFAVPLAILTSARIKADGLFMDAYKLVGGLTHLRHMANLWFAMTFTRPVRFVLFWSSLLTAGLVLPYAFLEHQGGWVWSLMLLTLGLSVAGIVSWMRQGAAQPIIARNDDGSIKRYPGKNEDGTPHPRAGEVMLENEDNFRPDRLSLVGSWLLIALQWSSLAVGMLLASAVEETWAFIPIGLLATIAAYTAWRAPLLFLGQVVLLLGGATESALGFLGQQLAVLAPGIRWDNVLQYVQKPDLFREEGPKLLVNAATRWVLTSILTCYGFVMAYPHPLTLQVTAFIIGLTNVFFALGSMRKPGKVFVQEVLDRNAVMMAKLGLALAIPLAFWHFLAPAAWKTRVAFTAENNAGGFSDHLFGSSCTTLWFDWYMYLFTGLFIAVVALGVGAFQKSVPADGAVARGAKKGFGLSYILLGVAALCFLLAVPAAWMKYGSGPTSLCSPLAMEITANTVSGGAVEIAFDYPGDGYEYALLQRAGDESGMRVVEVLDGKSSFLAPEGSKERGEIRLLNIPPHPGSWYYCLRLLKNGEVVSESRCQDRKGHVQVRAVAPSFRLSPDWSTVTVSLPAQGTPEVHRLERHVNVRNPDADAWETLPADFTKVPNEETVQAVDRPARGDWLYRVVVTKDGGHWTTANLAVHVGKFTADKPANKTAAAPKVNGTDEEDGKDAEAGRPKKQVRYALADDGLTAPGFGELATRVTGDEGAY